MSRRTLRKFRYFYLLSATLACTALSGVLVRYLHPLTAVGAVVFNHESELSLASEFQIEVTMTLPWRSPHTIAKAFRASSYLATIASRRAVMILDHGPSADLKSKWIGMPDRTLRKGALELVSPLWCHVGLIENDILEKPKLREGGDKGVVV